MRFLKPLNRYVADDSGAVTVDWVVLTAVVVVMGAAVIAIFTPGIQSAATKINNVVTSQLTNY